MHDDPKLVPSPRIFERMEDTLIPGRRWTTKDARGIRVPLKNPEWSPFPDHERERWKRLMKRMEGDELVGFVVAVPIYAAVTLPVIWVINSSASLSSFVAGLPWLLQAAIAVLPGLYVARRCMKSPDAAAITREFIAVGMCPSCVYSLQGVPAAADGSTVCPECGAAWRMTRETGDAP